MGRPTKYFAKNLAHQSAPASELDVEALGEGRYAVTLDGHRFELESLVLPHGAVSMILDGQSFSVEFDEKGDEVSVLLRGQLTRFDVADTRKLRLRAATAGFRVEGMQTVCAPMPGKVVKLLVKQGEAVTEGQGLVVIEAMKMENELKSAKAGVVTKIAIQEGQAVENGALLAIVE